MKEEIREVTTEKQIDPRSQSISDILYRDFSTKKMLLPMSTDFFFVQFILYPSNSHYFLVSY